MAGRDTWLAIAAAGQLITALMSVIVAIVAVRFAKRQSSTTLMGNLNSLWSNYNSTMLSNAEARDTLATYKRPVIAPLDDLVIDMILNIYETSYLLYSTKLMPKSYYNSTVENVTDTLKTLPNSALERFLERGYHPEFARHIRDEISKRSL